MTSPTPIQRAVERLKYGHGYSLSEEETRVNEKLDAVLAILKSQSIVGNCKNTKRANTTEKLQLPPPSPNQEEMDTSKVNRVEVIDHTPYIDESDHRGRVYVKWVRAICKDHRTQNCPHCKPKVELSLQDEGRTLKIFITKS